MWFGTNDGLNRYDGYEFVVYHAAPEGERGLSHDTVTSLMEDESGGLWIGTRGGLDRLDLETGRFTHYAPDHDDPHSLIDDEILVLYQDSGKTLWVGTSAGLDRFDREVGRFLHYRADADDAHSLPDRRVMSIYEDSLGFLWVGTWRGPARWDPDTNSFTHYQLAPEDVTDLGHSAVWSIVEDSGGTLWVGTGGSGFYRFDRRTEQFSQLLVDPEDVGGFAHNDVRSLCEDQTGALWLGTDGGGLYRFDRDEARLTGPVRYQKDPRYSGSLSSNYVNAIYESRRGVLWIGTSGGGISKLDRDRQKFVLYQADPSEPGSLSHNRVLALCEDREGGLWVGTDGGGLDRFDRESGTFTHYTHDPDDPHSLSNNCVTAIHQGQDGDLWVGTWGGGMAKFDLETGQFAHYQADPFDPHSLSSNLVHSLYQDHEGVLWIGTDVGLERLDPAAGRFASYIGSGTEVWAIYEDPEQDLWFATSDGIGRFDRRGGRVIRYRTDAAYSGSRSQDQVNAIHQDRAGTLWIGTRGGLSRFDPDAATFTHYGEEDGLANDVVQAILEDDQGYLWISTAGGLSRFDPESGAFSNYDVSDGLHGYEFTRASCKRGDGMMFFGGINGFNGFAPDRVKDNPYAPPVVLTSLTQGGSEVAVGRVVEEVTDVRLAWPNNLFEFGFVALNYHQPEKNQYAYKLEGFDRDWNMVGTRRFGRYTNLPGGTYDLLIKASNNDGIWNEKGIAVEVTVVPPFWATWWFRGGALAVLVAGAAAGYQLRVRGIEARSRDLEKLAADRTVALSRANELLKQEISERKRAEEALAQRAAEAAVAAERSRLARELHDAVTQLLFSASLIAEALPDIWENDEEEGRELLAEMRRLSRGALAEMRTLLLELRPAALIETSLAELLSQLAEAAVGRTDVTITVEQDGELTLELPRDVHVALYRIAQEALNNIIKHARAHQATISLGCVRCGDGSDGQQQVTLSVSDDGCGFDPDRVLPDHMGLGIIRERADRIGAELDIESESGRGTEVMVKWRAPCP
jgi:ligand-binding sensor domain-containing protein/signal transduction histidine kinase